jgi:hypothetical protein
MPIQSCGQCVGAPRGKAGAWSNAHTELRAKCNRSAREGSDIPKSAYIERALPSVQAVAKVAAPSGRLARGTTAVTAPPCPHVTHRT